MTAAQHSAATNGVHQMADSTPSSYQPTTVASSELPQPDPSVDTSFEAVNQVAWAFIEQYYTTLGKNPDKLYLLYKSSSFFTCGHDGESSPCGNGITQIQERVKALNCKNAKFRLTNIDAQPSDTSILIQVIGDFCRTPGTAQRFVQSFVLARQTNGYYVLNDIFRSLNEVGVVVDDEQTEEAKPAAKEEAAVKAESKPQEVAQEAEEDVPAVVEEPPSGITEPPPSQPPVDKTQDAEPAEVITNELDQKLEEVAREADEEPVSELPQPEQPEASAPEEPKASVESEDSTTVNKEEVPETQPETSAPPATDAWKSRAAKESPVPRAPPKPSVPKTWASLAAQANKSAASKPTPSAPAPASTSNTPAPATASGSVTSNAAAPAATAAAPAPKAAPAPQSTPASSKPATSSTNGPSTLDSESDGWVAVGAADSKRSRGNAAFNAPDARPEPEFRGYIKNVVASVTVADLSAALAKCDVIYLDISRQKNCAFVDFGSQAALNNAISSSPYAIGDEQIFVEERRAPRGGFQSRNGVPSRHPRNGAPQNPRGGFNKEGGRGSYGGRGGRGSAYRGRGQA